MASVGKTASGTPHKNVIVLRPQLHLYQTCSAMPEKVLLGTLELESEDLIPFEPGGPMPADLKWATTKARPLDVVKITCAKSLQAGAFTPSKAPGYTVRNRVGHLYGRHAEWQLDPALERGGYCFAPSETPDGDLVGKGGAANARRLLRVELAINGGKKTYPLLLRYPKDPRAADWIYLEHTFRLSLELVIGEARFELEGPEVVHPAFEFPTDGTRDQQALVKALRAEYGNPALAKPVGPLPNFLRYLAPGSFGDALRTYAAAAAAFVNGNIPAGAGFSVTALEILTTFLTEGGILAIDDAVSQRKHVDKARFDGYQHLGIDCYVTRWLRDEGNLRAYTSPSLTRLLTDSKPDPNHVARVRANKHVSPAQPDELGQIWQTFVDLTMEDAVYSVAGLYTFFKERFAHTVADPKVMGPWVTKPDELPAHLQAYWGTFYYNTSAAQDNGTRVISAQGVEAHDPRYKQPFEPKLYEGDGKFNANWRTATYRLLAALAGVA